MNLPQETPSRATGLAMLVALIATSFVTVVVNVQMYSARWKFAGFYPEKAAERPSTISESIADPRIGEPFANWHLLCAPLLFVGVACLILSTWREARASGKATLKITTVSWVLVVLQAMASVGLVILSQYRFPDFRDQHMAGSYVFFFSQAFVVVTGEILSRAYANLGPEGQVAGRVWSPRFARWRRRFVWVPIILGVTYLCLFLGKGYAPEALRYEVYAAYVSTELFLLSSFLFYMMTYTPDMWRVWTLSRVGYSSVEVS
ncbi:hypothetical protein [Shimia sagamensis]|uniref:Frag1/DRAM/Sfk1 family protein n=1 Tax=Shimia sagamensis TaxID=1566352 RepID=A0ABY1N9C4_9RHOB|nr:hypothetical protein [Shimia sagamensis]SMP03643.1 Frag1/DRAM/Sfk1 family protein [Shimia sagamensis]